MEKKSLVRFKLSGWTNIPTFSIEVLHPREVLFEDSDAEDMTPAVICPISQFRHLSAAQAREYAAALIEAAGLAEKLNLEAGL